MILASATLVAGLQHAKYAPGTSLPAILFVNVQTTDEVNAVASRELTERGWATMAIEYYKAVTDLQQFRNKSGPEVEAFHDALEKGFGVVVYPEAGST